MRGFTTEQSAVLLDKIKMHLDRLCPKAVIGCEKVEEINGAELIRFTADLEKGGKKIQAKKLILVPVKEGKEDKEAQNIAGQLERELNRKRQGVEIR